MKRFLLEKSQDEFYTSHSGLALVGLCLNRFTSLTKRLEPLSSLKQGAISHADVVRSTLGLLILGKSDFAAIEAFRQDRFFREALGLKEVPSEPTLRQRLAERVEVFLPIVTFCGTEFLQLSGALFSTLATGHVPLDIDVFTMDNSGTKKEKVSRTYQGFDGYAPIAAYLAKEGWLVASTAKGPSTARKTSFRSWLASCIRRAP